MTIMAIMATNRPHPLPPLTLSILPTSVIGICFSAGSCTATTDFAIATASGGSGGNTYLWTFVSGDVVTIVLPTADTTAFSNNDVTDWITSSVYRCTVTDSDTNTASDTVIVQLSGNDIN